MLGPYLLHHSSSPTHRRSTSLSVHTLLVSWAPNCITILLIYVSICKCSKLKASYRLLPSLCHWSAHPRRTATLLSYACARSSAATYLTISNLLPPFYCWRVANFSTISEDRCQLMAHWPAFWLHKWLVKSPTTNPRTTAQICTKKQIYWAVEKCCASFTSHAWHYNTCRVWSHSLAYKELDSPDVDCMHERPFQLKPSIINLALGHSHLQASEYGYESQAYLTHRHAAEPEGPWGTSLHKVLCGGSVPPQNLTAAGTWFRHLWSSEKQHGIVSLFRSTPASKWTQNERMSLSSV